MTIRGNLFNVSIVQGYAPTGVHSDQEIEAFYEDLDFAMKQTQDIKIRKGNLNAKIGQGREGRLVGPCGIRQIN